MKTTTLIFWALLWGIFVSSPFEGFSATNVSENFDGPEWPTVTGSAPSVTTATNLVINGWTLTRGIGGTGEAATSSTNYLWLFRYINPNISRLTSPLLTNGIGTISFDYRNSTAQSSGYNLLIKTYNGTSWTTNDVITNAAATYTAYSKTLNLTNAQQLIIERWDTLGGTTAIDTLLITTPPPVVNLSNLTNTPALPTDQDPVAISANVSIQGLADTFAMTNYWREWPSTSWTNQIIMTSNAPGLYQTVSNIPPKAVGSLIEYYAQATYSSFGISTNTTSISNMSYLVRAKSSYTNLAVIGQLNASLSNGASYLWQGVIQVTNANPTFKFQGISNGVPVTWGDTNQTITSVPLSGQAEVTSTNITLYTTNNGYYLFTFNETNLQYSVMSCAYENFNTWTNADSYTPPHTNSANWILSSANTSNDTSRIYSGAGRSAIVETNGWIQTPYLSNGVGQISFWYRNWPTNGTPAGKYQIQLSSNATSWSSASSLTVSNIVSTNFLFFSITTNDYASKYVRIQNTQTSATSRICFDEIVIAQAGAGVSGVSATPTNATIIDPVTIAIDLTPYNGATITNVTAWYRFNTNSAWTPAPMISTNGTRYMLTNSFTGLPVGTLYYAIQCDFYGFQAVSPGLFPSTNAAATVTIALPSDSRYEPFDAPQWPTITSNNPSTTLASNFVVNGWTVTRGLGGTTQIATSSTNYLWMFRNNTSVTSRLLSPLLTNGIGSVTFSYRNTTADSANYLLLIKTYDGSSWTTNDIITNALATYIGYTNALNLTNAQQFMIERADNLGGATAIDTVRITYPPANVAVTNVYINPGYPVAGQAFTASCDVVSLNPIFPAYSIAPKLYYWTSGALTSNAMTRSWTSGTTNRYTLIQSLSNITRDSMFNYYVRADFDGYYGSSPENKSPRFSITNSVLVRASASAYQTIGVTVNNAQTTGRLLTNGLWQTVFTASSTNKLTFSFAGSGYSSGMGYATNSVSWGNTNANWQTTFPLADSSSTNQASFSIIGTNNEFSGQYVMRFDESTGQYIILRCVSQDFDNWASDDLLYKLESKGSTPTIKDSFDTWTTNKTKIRFDSFTDGRWTAVSAYTNFAKASPDGWAIFESKITAAAMVTTNSPALGKSFAVQANQETTESDGFPMKGVGTVSFTYKCNAVSNNNNSIGVYLYTNVFLDPFDYTIQTRWISATNSVITNTVAATYTVTLNTNTSADIIIAHYAGNSTVTFDDLSVSEWYADSQTNSGWYTSEAWVEPRSGSAGNILRFDASRANKGVEQFVVTPMLSNGINTISLEVCSASTDPVSFTLSTRTNIYESWVERVSTNLSGFSGAASDYRTFSWLGGITAETNTYLKITHTTNSPGILLIDNVKITGASVGATWEINNVAVDDTDHPIPPQVLGARQYYDGFCNLNSNRTSNLASSTLTPYTTTWPYIISPILSAGIGEISFRYRNWTTSGAISPARLIIQTTDSTLATTNDIIWTTVDILDNIVNTNDYQYYQYIVNNSTSRYVRIYNDDQYTSRVGRVCLDDVLIAEPLAATLSMSNLVITPSIPLYSNTVQIAADIYKLFLAPTNITLTAYYATATTYAALSAATPIPLGMSCISSSPATPGQWYRYQTTNAIPTNAIDTFVKYYVKATYGGYQAASTSPRSLSAFTTYPAWYAPMDQVYTNGIAYYVVYSCPTGSVWINEICPLDTDGSGTWIFTNEFIELCGPIGASINNWSIELVYSDASQLALYSITNNPNLHSPTNGHGFWVMGVTNISNTDQPLTVNAIDDPGIWEPSIGARKMAVFGGVKLRRSWGSVEQAVFYNTDISLVPSGYSLTAAHPLDNNTGSIGLTGSGTNYSDFGWLELISATPGTINQGQTIFGVTGQETPPVFLIYSIFLNTNVWIQCTRATNWHTTPWYSTNLLSSNSWTVISDFNRTPSGSNDLLNFIRTTNSRAYFYKVVATNSP